MGLPLPFRQLRLHQHTRRFILLAARPCLNLPQIPWTSHHLPRQSLYSLPDGTREITGSDIAVRRRLHQPLHQRRRGIQVEVEAELEAEVEAEASKKKKLEDDLDVDSEGKTDFSIFLINIRFS